MKGQRNGKFSCIEWERRFLVRQLLAEIRESRNYRCITDNYISGTRLRLRRVEANGRNEVVFKLTQKFADASSPTMQTTITTLYLDEAEYKRLAVLEGNEITKRRYGYHYEGQRFGLDVFMGRHEGLILAEVECKSEEELKHLALPPFIVREVTEEVFFTGGALASVTVEEFRRTLAKLKTG